eukprot:10401503-Ditylum_brightwellii.AAC.1
MTVSPELIPTTFADFDSNLPDHVQQTMGTLQSENVDVQYWIRALHENTNCISKAHVIVMGVKYHHTTPNA